MGTKPSSPPPPCHPWSQVPPHPGRRVEAAGGAGWRGGRTLRSLRAASPARPAAPPRRQTQPGDGCLSTKPGSGTFTAGGGGDGEQPRFYGRGTIRGTGSPCGGCALQGGTGRVPEDASRLFCPLCHPRPQEQREQARQAVGPGLGPCALCPHRTAAVSHTHENKPGAACAQTPPVPD